MNKYVYGYARISKDDEGEGQDSIASQIEIIKSYCKKNKLKLIDIIVDSKSGYLFDREGLKKLESLINNNLCDMIIFKDDSRLGRKQNGILDFVDIMEKKNIRYVFITNAYDSLLASPSQRRVLGIYSWVNEQYVYDISTKVKASMHQKQEEGLVITPPYGYKKDKSITEFEYMNGKRRRINKPNFIIDDESAIVIKEIFDLYISGHGGKKIAEILNEKNIATPRKRKEQIRGSYRSGIGKDMWYHTAIYKIIDDKSYIGTLVNHKTERKNIKGTRVDLPESKHVIIENFYPRIIEDEIFELAQNIRNKRKTNDIKSKGNLINLFTGVIKCNECKKNMVSTARKRVHSVTRDYRCGSYHKYGKTVCTPHTIKEEFLVEIIKEDIKEICNNVNLIYNKVDDMLKQYGDNFLDYNKAMEDKKKEILDIDKKINLLDEKLLNGTITDEKYFNLNTKLEQNKKDLIIQIDTLKNESKNELKLKENIFNSKKLINGLKNNSEINRKTIDILIDSIFVSENNNNLKIKIVYNAPFNVFNEVTSPCGDSTSLERLYILVLKAFSNIEDHYFDSLLKNNDK